MKRHDKLKLIYEKQKTLILNYQLPLFSLSCDVGFSSTVEMSISVTSGSLSGCFVVDANWINNAFASSFTYNLNSQKCWMKKSSIHI